MKTSSAHVCAIAIVFLISVSCNKETRIVSQSEVNRKANTDRTVVVHKNGQTDSSHDFQWATDSLSEPVFPGEKWAQVDPIALGWKSQALDAAKKYYDELNADACMIIQHGYVVAAWGDVEKPIECRSIRKSFLGSLIGIYHGKGIIDLEKTLASMNIDEKTPLTDTERMATVRHLVSSRSGIYLPAAYDPNDHPARGTYKPGEVWHYNNWDFNVLLTVFEKETKKKIFNTFEEDIAIPLQMQDFRMSHTEYVYEKVSLHPAYLFSTSARDDARMGLLWLNEGRWRNTQIIPASWMKESTSLQTDLKGSSNLSLRDGYGFLFWIDKDKNNIVVGFSALGASGQFIYMNFTHDLVVVLRADPGSVFNKWLGLRLDPEESYKMVDLILEAAPDK